ncbi:hypothetical protein DFH06DRAFT_1147008 [Mycena polygramma]|nr:hypothetical protein DFH06DRAFT_1147008 [Mycena polygramma]
MFGPIAYEEGGDTAPDPNVDTEKAEKLTPTFAWDTGAGGGEAEDKRVSWTQSKPRTKSQGKEAATATSGKKIEMKPALQGSLSEPERKHKSLQQNIISGGYRCIAEGSKGRHGEKQRIFFPSALALQFLSQCQGDPGYQIDHHPPRMRKPSLKWGSHHVREYYCPLVVSAVVGGTFKIR